MYACRPLVRGTDLEACLNVEQIFNINECYTVRDTSGFETC